MRIVSLIVIIGIFSTMFAPNSALAAGPRGDGDLSDEFTDFRLENINSSQVDLSFDTVQSTDGIDSGQLYYVLLESQDDISSLFKSSAVLNGLDDLFPEEEYAVSNPELFLNTASGDVLRTGSIDELQGGVTNEEINLQGLPENLNYKLYVAAANPKMDAPDFNDVTETPVPNLADKYIKVELIDDTSGSREFKVSYGDSSESETLTENGGGDLIVNFGYSSGFDKDGSGYSYTLGISNGVDINEGDSWILQYDENGALMTNETDVIKVPKTQYLEQTADNPEGNLFQGNDGILRFSTDPFPSLLPGAGNSGDGFSVENAPTNQSFEYLRGVHSNVRGSVQLRFDNDIAITAKGREEIQILDSEGNDYRYYEATGDGVTESGSVMEIEYQALAPDKQYYVSIPSGSLATELGSNGLGQFNLGNEFNKIIFYTEKKPEIVSTFFNPGNDTFDHNFSPFSLNPSDDIYRIPDLVGVNKIGVGVNQQLVMKFQDKIVLNGNPTSKLRISSSGDNRNLVATAKVNENRPNELIITVEHGNDNRDLLRPDVIYDLVIEPGIVKDHYGGSSFSESDTIEVSFKTADGFKNAFLDKSSYELNSGLLQTPSHNIAIDVPKVYIRNVETIHYRQGLAPDAQVAPNITNVDVEADPDVAYLTVTTNQDERSMLERGANGKFTATFAGLSSNVTQLEITAYDVNENELVTRIFRLQGAPGSEFKNDYVPEITDVFGKRISLYELMQQPDLMRQVLEQIPVSELDRIGVLDPFFAPYNDVP